MVLQDGRFQIVNTTFTKMFGYTQLDVDEGLSFFKLVQDKDKEAVHQQYVDRLAGRQVPQTFRIDLIAKDGTIKPCETSATVIKYDRQPADLVLIRDVSERVHTKNVLRESEDEYRGLFENIPEGAYQTLPNGTIIKANPALVKMLGYESEEELRNSVCAVDLYPNLGNRLDLTCTLEKEGELRNVEIDLKCKDGRQITALENARVVRDASGQVSHYEGMLTDITERKEAERKLQESENKFRSITENAVDSIFIRDMARRYTFVNQAMQELLGLPEEEILGKTPEEIFGPEQGQNAKEVDDRTFSGETVNETTCLVIGDKEYCFNTLQTPLSMEDGEVTSIMGIVRDITDTKRAEQNVQALARIVERSLNEVYIFDAETFRFIQVNYGARENIGYTAEELTRMTPLDIKPEFTKESFIQLVEPLRSGAKEITTFETVHERKDASLYDVEVHLQLSEFLDKPVFVAIILDTTERKKAEEALRESEEKHRLFFENAPIGIIHYSREGIITGVNEAMITTFGSSHEKLIGLDIEEIPDKRFANEVHKSLNGKPGFFEGEYTSYTGNKTAYISANWIPIKENGDVVAGVGIVEDITERKQAEGALRESEEKLRNIVEHSTNLFYSHTPEHELTYLSPQSRDILQCDPDEAMIRWTEFATDNPVNERGFALTEKAIKTGKRQPPYELELMGKKGRIVWGEVHEAPVVEKGKTVAVVGSLTDITERKLSVEKLRETTEDLEIERQELTEKNIALKQILEHIESQKQSYRQQVCSDMENAITPAITRLKKKVGPEFAGEFEDLETAIAVVLSKDIEEHLARYSKLTTRESEICDMIKAGMSSKQIADSLNLSLPTVLKHREHARAKLGITGKTLSLSTYLRSH